MISILVICISFGTISEADSLSLSIDGNEVTFDDSTGYPFIDAQNRTMMPLRVCLNSIGCTVQWDQYNQTVIARKGPTEVVIPVGKSEISVNQQIVSIDTTAVLKNGRTYLPLRAVFEAFKYRVDWNNDTKAVIATSSYTPYNINGGTTGVFLRKQLNYTGFDGIQADITLPKVKLGQKGDCPYVYFGFDFPGDNGNAEGGFQFIEDQNNPGYNKWTIFLRQGNDWRWGDNILLDQESYHNLKFYADKVSDTQTDLVIVLDGREVVRKTSAVNNFDKASVKYVDAIAMSVPFDGLNCPTASVDAGCFNLMVSEIAKDEYADFEEYDLYSEFKNGFWYGTVEGIPDYMHYYDINKVSLYRTNETGESIAMSSDGILSGEVSNTFSAGGALRHELSSTELNELISFFNSCNIKEGEREWTTMNDHDHLSDSIDLVLRQKTGWNQYIMCFYDGDIMISDENGSYYYLHNSALQDYIINTMGKYLAP
jgi:hypothetical protein